MAQVVKKAFFTEEWPKKGILLNPSSVLDPSLSPLPFALFPLGAEEGYRW